MLNSRVHTILKVFPPTPSQAPSTLPPCLPIILKSMLRNGGYQAMGEKAALLRTMSIHVTDRMYIFSKCYVGFCTPRRTEMDPRTKKGIVDMRVWVWFLEKISNTRCNLSAADTRCKYGSRYRWVIKGDAWCRRGWLENTFVHLT